MLRVSVQSFAGANGLDNAVPRSSGADSTAIDEPPPILPLPPMAERPFWSVMIPIYNAREDYLRETLSSPTNLAVFLPFLDENSFPARLLGSIDLFVIWWSISLAIGLGVLYRKRTGPIATTLLVIYVTIGLVIAAVKTALAGA